ncbi:MAG: hypothetical protein ACRCUS_05165 [Anaerovoracaceae bacterium]
MLESLSKAIMRFSVDKYKKLSKSKYHGKPGYIFVGWAKNKNTADMHIVNYYDKAKIKNLSSKHGKAVKLYAVYIKWWTLYTYLPL